MSKKKVLIVTQEMQPYTALSEISEIARKLPQFVQENGMEIRVLFSDGVLNIHIFHIRVAEIPRVNIN